MGHAEARAVGRDLSFHCDRALSLCETNFEGDRHGVTRDSQVAFDQQAIGGEHMNAESWQPVPRRKAA